MNIDRTKFVGGKKASEIVGVHQRTLYLWEEKGLIETIRTPGGKRLYNVEKYLKEKICDDNNKIKNTILCDNLEDLDKKKDKLNICYVRVSSNNQKDDLERQKNLMVKLYPKYLIIEDIGSGLNLNKRGIKKIINLAIEGKINELVVAYKDRLTRFGFELIEELIEKYSKGKIIIVNQKNIIEPEEELVKDVMSILNVYVAKMNGLRKYNKIPKVNKIEKNNK
jgi:predicted site-specific integrase-resolvase